MVNAQSSESQPRHAKRSLRPVRAGAQATHDALLTTARRMLAEVDFDDLSIAHIVKANGLSVGSFYGRFHNKASFFEEMQAQVTAEWRASFAEALSPQKLRGMSEAQTVFAICATVVGHVRKDAGFLRAALKHSSTQPAAWTPIQVAGHAVVEVAAKALRQKRGKLAGNQRAALRFAMQMVYGTCINAVLHDPGPIYLQSQRLEQELARVLCLYLGVPMALPAPAASTS